MEAVKETAQAEMPTGQASIINQQQFHLFGPIAECLNIATLAQKMPKPELHDHFWCFFPHPTLPQKRRSNSSRKVEVIHPISVICILAFVYWSYCRIPATLANTCRVPTIAEATITVPNVQYGDLKVHNLYGLLQNGFNQRLNILDQYVRPTMRFKPNLHVWNQRIVYKYPDSSRSIHVEGQPACRSVCP